MSTVILPLVNGLSQAMLLFLIASGLTLVFGVLGILNFSHGALFMMGAYVGYSLIQDKAFPLWLFILIVLLSGVAVGILGALIEILVLRRIYHVDEIFILLATFSLLLILQGTVHQIWGATYLSVNFPQGFGGGINIGDMTIPSYSLFIILVGFLVAAILWFVIQKTSIGKLIRASAEDSKMTSALGVNVPVIFTIVFVVGSFLAGMAGLIAAPSNVLTPSLAITFIIKAFGAVIVGGLGSIQGAFIASIILSLFDSYLTDFVPFIAGSAFFVGMIIILLVKPKGIFTSPSS
jgi:branched-chain amino acid transport system permease protein